MYAKENSYGNPSSPLKKGLAGGSPISSPLKQPRNALYSGYDNSYKPADKTHILGTPLEIIQGKSRHFHI